MEAKIDYKKKYPGLYNPSSKTPEIADVPNFKFLMIDGLGMDFGNRASQNAIEALFGVSYKAKFRIKKEQGVDYAVMPLEGLWWADDLDDFVKGNRDQWRWTYMIMQPEWVSEDILKAAAAEVKKSKENPAFDLLRFEDFAEGRAAQIMHIGPFAEEHPNIMRVHQLIADRGGRFDGKVQKHHEIYLNDFRKTAPARLKTVLRQPFVLN